MNSIDIRERGGVAEWVTSLSSGSLDNSGEKETFMNRDRLEKLAADERFIPGIYNYCDRWCVGEGSRADPHPPEIYGCIT